MARRYKTQSSNRQPDMFGWAEAQDPVPRFEPQAIRAATLQARIRLAMKLSLAECGLDRAEIARRMSAFLGETVSTNMLNAYVSQGAGKPIPLERFMAFIQATGDKRLLNLLTEPFDFIVVDRRCEAWITAGKLAAEIKDKAAELNASESAFGFALRMAKAGIGTGGRP